MTVLAFTLLRLVIVALVIALATVTTWPPGVLTSVLVLACASLITKGLDWLLGASWRRPREHGEGRVRVAFVHPDLGIGGAERLVVDAAVALLQAEAGPHEVVMFTARHEPDHCYEETKDGRLQVVVYGSFLPRRILGRFYAACAYLRMCWVSMRLILANFDVIIVDQVSICLPILRLAMPKGIIFYCHYPDQLLTQRQSFLKSLYRAPLDFMEEETTGMADVVFVNSNFTAGVFGRTFRRLHGRGLRPSVLYPPLNLEEQDKYAEEACKVGFAKLSGGDLSLGDAELLLLSINRFERKKNLALAIKSFAALPEEIRAKAKLVLAGGYDAKLPENVEHAEELRQEAKELQVAERVVQMRSISTLAKAALLGRACCLLYTPEGEHFGIVPVEAMYARVPVVAVNSGGPLESVADGETGFLCPPDPTAWAGRIQQLLQDEQQRLKMGEAGRKRVAERFSLAAFGRTLDGEVRRLAMGASDGVAKKQS